MGLHWNAIITQKASLIEQRVRFPFSLDSAGKVEDHRVEFNLECMPQAKREVSLTDKFGMKYHRVPIPKLFINNCDIFW